MKKKWKIIFNLLFRGVEYKEVESSSLIFETNRDVIIVRKVFDVLKSDFSETRNDEFYVEKVREGLVNDPVLLELIEVEYSTVPWQKNIIRFEAEIRIVK